MTSAPRDSKLPEIGDPAILLDRVRGLKLRSPNERKDLQESASITGKASAAVSLVLKPSSNGSPEILLLKRQTFEGDPWSGQISLPGGRSKEGETPLRTATREAMEETRIDLDKCEVIGVMEEIYPGDFSVSVTPFVVIAPGETTVEIDHYEIVDFFWSALSYFSDLGNSSTYTFSRKGVSFQTPSFIVMRKYVVWGMTLRIIQNLLTKLKEA